MFLSIKTEDLVDSKMDESIWLIRWGSRCHLPYLEVSRGLYITTLAVTDLHFPLPLLVLPPLPNHERLSFKQ